MITKIRAWWYKPAIEIALNWFIERNGVKFLHNEIHYEIGEEIKRYEFYDDTLSELEFIQKISSGGNVLSNIICLNGKPVYEIVDYYAKSWATPKNWEIKRYNYGNWCILFFRAYLGEYKAWRKSEKTKTAALFEPLDE